jgi:hypothetical protein
LRKKKGWWLLMLLFVVETNQHDIVDGDESVVLFVLISEVVGSVEETRSRPFAGGFEEVFSTFYSHLRQNVAVVAENWELLPTVGVEVQLYRYYVQFTRICLSRA